MNRQFLEDDLTSKFGWKIIVSHWLILWKLNKTSTRISCIRSANLLIGTEFQRFQSLVGFVSKLTFLRVLDTARFSWTTEKIAVMTQVRIFSDISSQTGNIRLSSLLCVSSSSNTGQKFCMVRIWLRVSKVTKVLFCLMRILHRNEGEIEPKYF